MANILKITSIKMDDIYIPYGGFGLEPGLVAHYENRHYYLFHIGHIIKEDLKAPIALYFSCEYGKYVRSGLNAILLMSDGEGDYKAKGITTISAPKFSNVPTEAINIHWHPLDDDLKIDVDPNADESIKSLLETTPELFLEDPIFS